LAHPGSAAGSEAMLYMTPQKYRQTRSRNGISWLTSCAPEPTRAKINSPGAVSRPRSPMGVDFMRKAAPSTDNSGQGEIVRPDFRPGKRKLSKELTGHSSGQVAGVIE
jgi:hypothetical protein